MDQLINFTPVLADALNAAAYAHAEHRRKGTDIPYITHPVGVMIIASQVTSDEDVLVASLFHDVLEDVPERFSREEMATRFGERVVSIVEGVSKDDTIKDWRLRSEAYLAHLEAAAIESVIVSGADKTHNLMAILADHAALGDELWSRFNAGKEQQQWWYSSVSELVSRRLPDSPLAINLAELVTQLLAL